MKKSSDKGGAPPQGLELLLTLFPQESDVYLAVDGVSKVLLGHPDETAPDE